VKHVNQVLILLRIPSKPTIGGDDADGKWEASSDLL